MASSDPVPPGPGAPKEPLLTVGAVTAVAAAAVTLIVAFGVRLTTEQQVAILGLVAVLSPFIVALVGRAKVFSPDSVRRLLRLQASGGAINAARYND